MTKLGAWTTRVIREYYGVELQVTPLQNQNVQSEPDAPYVWKDSNSAVDANGFIILPRELREN